MQLGADPVPAGTGAGQRVRRRGRGQAGRGGWPSDGPRPLQAAAKEFGVPQATAPLPWTGSLGASCGSSGGALSTGVSVVHSSQDGFETFQTAGKFRGSMQKTGGVALGITTGSVLCPDRSKCLPGLMQALHVCACTSMDTHSRGVDILGRSQKANAQWTASLPPTPTPRRPSILLWPLSTPLL